jgi:predicted RNA-binding protein associated with RNAse of E/G family
VVEHKVLLDGRRQEFSCRVIASAPGALTVLFVSDRPYQVPGLGRELPTGTVTFGHFWAERPYNVYHWMDPAGRTLAHYFNLASDTVITEGHLHWRDLTVDVLVRPGQAPQVLDEDELPGDLSPELRSAVEVARAAVLAEQSACVPELEGAATALWPRVFGQEREPA